MDKDINRMVAEKVMGWKRIDHKVPIVGTGRYATYAYYNDEGECEATSLWNPCENISDAWMLVEKMKDMIVEDLALRPVLHWNSVYKKWKFYFEGTTIFEYNESAPMAISLASLEAVK